MEPIKLNSGKITIPIETDGKVTGEISFNPKVANFAENFYSAYQKIKEKLKEYEVKAAELDAMSETLTEDSDQDLSDLVRFPRRVCEDVYSIIDEIFGTGTSKTVFGDNLNFEMIGVFFDGISPHVEKARGELVARYSNKPSKRVMK